jgi:hypothetical protein
MGKTKYDVFVSYSHNDQKWTKDELLPRLEAHGYRVCIDYRDFAGGKFSVDEMERAVKESRKTVCVNQVIHKEPMVHV